MLAVVGGILCSSVWLRGGGFIHPEPDMFLVDHLSDRPYLSRILCPQIIDARDYMARPLSHVLEDFDAHLVYWSYLAGWPHFYSGLTFALLLGITCLHWHLGVNHLKLDKLSLLLLLALFWVSPNIYLAGNYFRAAKIAVAFSIYGGLYVLLTRIVRASETESARVVEPARSWRPGVLYLLAALAACFSDTQGVFLVLLFGGLAALLWVGLRSRELGLAGCAAGLACAIHTVYQFSLGPFLVRRFAGLDVANAYERLRGTGLRTQRWEHVKAGAHAASDTLSFCFGHLPWWVFGPVCFGLVIAAFLVRPEMERDSGKEKSKHAGLVIGLSVVLLLLGNVVMYVLMVARHPPLRTPELLRSGYYGLPTTVVWLMLVTVLVRLLQDRFRWRQWTVSAALAVLLAFNVESLPLHYRISKTGDYEGYIKATPYLLQALKTLRNEPDGDGTSKKFDALKSSQLEEIDNMIHNPMTDLNLRGSVEPNIFIRTSRYLNFLRSKKGLPCDQPW